MSAVAEKTLRFMNPPVIERVLGLLCTPDPTLLVTEMEAWTEQVRPSFPRDEKKVHWALTVQEKDGVPVLDQSSTAIQVFHRHWQDNEAGGPVKCLQTRQDGFFVNLQREKTNLHSFEELFADFVQWLPLWQDRFGVGTFHGLQLLYVNELSARITPQFVTAEGSLHIGRALRVFSNFLGPGPFSNLILPYGCQATLIVKDMPNTTMTIQTKAITRPNDPVPIVRIEMLVRTKGDKGNDKINLQAVADKSRLLHQILLTGFETFFTPEAITSFKPL